MSRSVVLVCLVTLAVGCGSSGGPASPGTSAPTIHQFTAAPATLPAGGGTVTLSWDVSDATALTVDPGLGAVTPATSGTRSVQVTGSTAFILHATGAGGSATASASVTVAAACDPTPGTLTGTCDVPSAGQCVDFANLSAVDAASLPGTCAGFGGTWGNTPCSATNRVGTCRIPPGGSTGVNCSPNGSVLERYYSSNYTQTTAQTACAGVPGTVFTPG